MAYKAVIVLAALYAMLLKLEPGMLYSLNYYTLLSNLVCMTYFICSLVWNARRMSRGGNAVTWLPRLQGAVVMCISVTLVIYHFILRPNVFPEGIDRTFWNPTNIIFHYAVPLMTIFDRVMFCPKNTCRKSDPLLWLSIPVGYCAYALIRGAIGGYIGPTESSFPYPFMDASLYGWSRITVNIVLISLGVIIMGYGFYFSEKAVYVIAVRYKARLRSINAVHMYARQSEGLSSRSGGVSLSSARSSDEPVFSKVDAA